ncbi:RNA polymerase sigma factor [bacterium]|nr:RNA polymerase sigma factor [bacterium]
MSNLRKKFSKVYDQNIDKIYRFIYLKVNSQEMAEDLTSETFLRGWEAFKNQKEIKNPQAFLYQIARNLVIDFYRKKEQLKFVSLDNCKEMSDPHTDLEKKSIVLSDIEEVRTALIGLKEDYQNIIIWRYLNDLPISEISKIIDKPEGTVRVMLHRALKELRGRLNSQTS